MGRPKPFVDVCDKCGLKKPVIRIYQGDKYQCKRCDECRKEHRKVYMRNYMRDRYWNKKGEREKQIDRVKNNEKS